MGDSSPSIPKGFAAGDVNLHRYVGNSWPNFRDPSGKSAESWLDENIFDTKEGRWLGRRANETVEVSQDVAEFVEQDFEDAGTILDYAYHHSGAAWNDFRTGGRTGVKADVNALGHTVQSLFTLGQIDSNGQKGRAYDLWAVTEEDRANGYDQAYMFGRIGWEVLALAGGGGLAKAAGTVGRVARGVVWAGSRAFSAQGGAARGTRLAHAGFLK